MCAVKGMESPKTAARLMTPATQKTRAGFVMCATNAVLFIALTPCLFVDKPVRARDRAASLDNPIPAFESLS
jgi:hypothetical protein